MIAEYPIFHRFLPFYIGFFAQLVDGTMGMGYGVVSTSFMVALGMPPPVASATVHLSEIATTFVSGVSHLSFKNVKKGVLWVLVLFGVPGGVLGAYALSSFPGEKFKPYVAGILLGLGFVILYRFIRDPEGGLVKLKGIHARGVTGIIGFFAALVDAVGGGGWGPIATPGLLVTGDLEPRRVVGSVNLAEFFVTVAISATFLATLGSGGISWKTVGLLIAGGVIAAPIAAWLARKLPHRPIGILIGLTVVLLNARTLLKFLLH